MEAWIVWLAVAVLLGIVEVTTLALVAGFFAGGALAASLVAALGGGAGWQVLSFIVVSVGLLAAIRPVIRRHMTHGSGTRTGVAALIGQSAVVIEQVDSQHGQVKLAGEVWSARPYDPGLVIEPGSPVHVMEIKGATALVYPTEDPWNRSD